MFAYKEIFLKDYPLTKKYPTDVAKNKYSLQSVFWISISRWIILFYFEKWLNTTTACQRERERDKLSTPLIPLLNICIIIGKTKCFFKNGPSSASFLSFQTNITILTTNKCEKCPSSIRCWDLNQHPLEHESPPITTRPGLRPERQQVCLTL